MYPSWQAYFKASWVLQALNQLMVAWLGKRVSPELSINMSEIVTVWQWQGVSERQPRGRVTVFQCDKKESENSLFHRSFKYTINKILVTIELGGYLCILDTVDSSQSIWSQKMYKEVKTILMVHSQNVTFI